MPSPTSAHHGPMHYQRRQGFAPLALGDMASVDRPVGPDRQYQQQQYHHSYHRLDPGLHRKRWGMPGERPPLRATALLLYRAALSLGSARLPAVRSAHPAARPPRLDLDSLHRRGGDAGGMLWSGNAARQIPDQARDLNVISIRPLPRALRSTGTPQNALRERYVVS